MNELGERRSFLKRGQVLPLQVLDGGNVQRIVLGQIVAYLHRDREILRQFAALLEEFERLQTPCAADGLVALPATFSSRRDDKIMEDAVLLDAGGKTFDGLAATRRTYFPAASGTFLTWSSSLFTVSPGRPNSVFRRLQVD